MSAMPQLPPGGRSGLTFWRSLAMRLCGGYSLRGHWCIWRIPGRPGFRRCACGLFEMYGSLRGRSSPRGGVVDAEFTDGGGSDA